MGVSVDLISNLPDEILHLILSSLPTTEEVIRTSILSKRWRYLWGWIPSVDIDCSRAGLEEFRKKEFKEFVFSVLINMSSNLDCFRLCCSNYYDTWTVVMWIYAGVLRHVKQLEFTFCPDEDIKLPDGLLACDSLEVLKLFLFRRSLSLSNFAAGFSALRVLELNHVELFAGDVEKFFKTCCPLLEDLSLLDCFMRKLDCLCISSPSLKTLRIDNRNLVDSASLYKDYEKQGLCIFLILSCQKLVYFEYGGHIAHEFLFELPSLKKAVIYPTRDILHQQKEITLESGDPISHMLAEVCYAESLSINYYVLQCMNAVDDYPKSLPNLKTLELRTMFDAITMNELNNILSGAPNLLTLHLIIQKGFSLEEFQTLARELDEVESNRIFTRYLKRVEFIEFNGEKEMLSVAQFLLEHGNALEEMVFSWDSKVKYQEKSTETTNEVSKFYKASSFVKLVTFVNDQ